MTPSFFHAIVDHKNDSSDQLREVLEEIKPGLFAMLDEHEVPISRNDFKDVVLYIGYAYSKQSPMRVLGANSMQEKKEIFERFGFAQHLYGDLVNLKSPAVRDVVSAYLDYQLNRDFAHMMRKKDLYDKLFEHQLSNVEDEHGKVDFKGTIEASKQLDKMLDDIEELENRLAKEYDFVFEFFKEMANKPDTRKSSLGLEDSGFLRH